MMPKRISVAFTMLVVLVIVSTLFLGSFVAWFYYIQKTRLHADLRRTQILLADQLANSLVLPLWNFDRDQMGKILDGAMRADDVFAVAVIPTNARGAGEARVRDQKWRSVSTAIVQPLTDAAVETRPIVAGGEQIGEMRLYVTDRWLVQELAAEQRHLLWGVFGFECMLVLSLWLIMWRLVLAPLQTIETYASKAGTADDRAELPVEGLHGEFASLGTSLQRMLTLLESRYRDLQASHAELHRSGTMLSGILNSVPQAVFWKDARGVYLGCNDVFAESCGLPGRDWVVGKTDLELPLSTADAERYRIDDADVIRSGQAKNKIVDALHLADGRRRWIETSKVPLTTEDGQTYGVLGVSSDITERRSMEEALREAEQRYHRLVDSAFDGSLVHQSGIIRSVTSSCAAMFGYTDQELIGDNIYRFVSSESLPAVLEQGRQGLNCNYETIGVRRDGTRIHVEISARDCLFEEKPARIVAVRNITERKRTEAALRESEERFAKAFQNAPVLICITDLKTEQLIEVNDEVLRVTGFARSEMIGRTVVEVGLVTVQTRPQLMAEFEQKARIHDLEIEFRTKDGKKLLGLVRGERVVVVGRDCLLVVIADITARKAIEAQLLQAQRMEAVGTLAGGIAHDLNNILAPMLMVCGVLRSKLTTSEDQELLGIIEKEAKRGGEIIKQLLAFGRGLESRRKLLQSRHILKEMLQMMRETFPRDIEVRRQVAANLWTVVADPTQLHQVVLNLCINARDAMPEGGVLTLTAANLELPAAGVTAPPTAKAGPYVCIEVADTGRGIPEEIRARIFDPFFTTKAVGQGTGLGLSTVLGIVQSHSGFVVVHSEVGQGSKFQVYLPASPSEVASEGERPATPAAPGSGEIILLVDDEPTIRTALRRALEQGGYRVITAENGSDALATFELRREEIRLILTDIMMPVMGGFALIKRVRERDQHLPIIAMSGMGDIDKHANVQEFQVAEVLMKPCSQEAVIAAVQRQLALA